MPNRPESKRAVSSRVEAKRNDKFQGIAHLHHEGLMDMKLVLSRGTSKRLNRIEPMRDEGICKEPSCVARSKN